MNTRIARALVLLGAMSLLVPMQADAGGCGFKLNMAMPPGAGEIYLSIPYINPYGFPTQWPQPMLSTAAWFCVMTGLTSTGIVPPRAQITVFDPETGVPNSALCGTPGAMQLVLPTALGFRVKSAGPNSIIIVGSHNSSVFFTVPKPGAGQIGSAWFAVPYCTTAVTANDLCLSSGLTSTGLNRATIIRFDPLTQTPTAVGSCGSASASAITLHMGEAVRIREANGVTRTFRPSCICGGGPEPNGCCPGNCCPH
jgi:hypothetical protein